MLTRARSRIGRIIESENGPGKGTKEHRNEALDTDEQRRRNFHATLATSQWPANAARRNRTIAAIVTLSASRALAHECERTTDDQPEHDCRTVRTHFVTPSYVTIKKL